MGQFSWLYSDTGKQMIDGKLADSYLLVPPPFQDKYGKWIKEDCYNGYGNMGRYDIYDLIIEWNKEMIPEVIRRIKNGNWRCSVSQREIKNLEKYYNEEEIDCSLRLLGIVLACYDEDNFVLEYPIKITSKPMEYNDAAPSEGDPDQGWEVHDDEDEEEW